MAFTPAVLDLQEERGASGIYDRHRRHAEELESDEIALITGRNSFYLATVSEEGWPYVQHRGGETGFVKVLGPTSIGWIERSGNRQYLGTGNITANGRVSMIFVDYATRTRLKMFGEATLHTDPSDDLVAALDGESVRNDGAITVEVTATAWNCPKYITPRHDDADVRAAIEHLQNRIAALETENATLRGS